MAAGDKYINCNRPLSLEAAVRSMVVENDNGEPIFRSSASGPPPVLIESVNMIYAGTGFNNFDLYLNADAGVNHIFDQSPPLYIEGAPYEETKGKMITMHPSAEVEMSIDGITWTSSPFDVPLVDYDNEALSYFYARIKVGTALQLGTISNCAITHADLVTPGNRGFEIYVSTASATLVSAWQTGLTGGKPSGKSLYATNNLVNGWNSDGDLAEMDYVNIFSGLHTDEQRLRPMKSISGLATTKVGVTLPPGSFADGFASTTSGGLDLKFTPSDGVKFAQDDASMFFQVKMVNVSNRSVAGITNSLSAVFTAGLCNCLINSSAGTPAGASSGSGGGFYCGKRISSAQITNSKNGILATTVNNTSAPRSSLSALALALNNGGVGSPASSGESLHVVGFGSKTLNDLRVKNRLKTYFDFLGISAAQA